MWSRPLPPQVDAALAAASDVLVAALDGRSMTLVVHGSLALGGFHPLCSDIDALALVEDTAGLPSSVGWAIGEQLVALELPGRGLELSVVDGWAAAHPQPPWPFVLHVTSDPADRKVVIGQSNGGDPDLLMHFVVARTAGIASSEGSVIDLIGAVDRALVLRYLADELLWAEQFAGEAYAVLNAGRALRFLQDSSLVSKVDGAAAALAAGAPHEVVARAVAVQEARMQDREPTAPARQLIAHVRVLLLNAI